MDATKKARLTALAGGGLAVVIGLGLIGAALLGAL